MSTFAEMNLPQSLAQRLTQAGLTTPTPVQQAAIPSGAEGPGHYGASQNRERKNAGVSYCRLSNRSCDGRPLRRRLAPIPSPDRASVRTEVFGVGAHAGIGAPD